ncbi:hypothetical protein, unknown function [Leishmania infantum JPCM5]|uniref:Palmitoyltransferase n=2 Tax=Leishmania infantum TaxID=5671 RepID=A0A6L0XLR8_LEIIN|nr:hypothetical protein, unknown function [Leishmania infantum JPCM5]CAC9513032.1 DHHC_palmitoyltransferase_-_putative [Leishmania infantum]CAM70017.1 hypothetical protein, unknown function [Leishmania infantum JPCM5]SUZ43937.1 DHHC_palmitoyltransferase_-_putative [Leishmania infantum]|eukprot:XP_001466967.1 hypothetical protein, unknown function [Leishmania infantum JPCM5]
MSQSPNAECLYSPVDGEGMKRLSTATSVHRNTRATSQRPAPPVNPNGSAASPHRSPLTLVGAPRPGESKPAAATSETHPQCAAASLGESAYDMDAGDELPAFGYRGGTSTGLRKKCQGNAAREYPVEGTGDGVLNPLRCEGGSDSGSNGASGKVRDGAAIGGAIAADDGQATSLSATESVKENGKPLFSLSNIPVPTTAEEYYARVAEIDHVRCGLGQELEGDAKDIYGPTWPFSRRMIASRVFGTKECPAPNCDKKTNIQAVTGPRAWALLFIYGILIVYPVFTTVAYAGESGWQCIIVLWLLSGLTIVFVTLCAFTNPGIVPRRRLRNVTDRGDILIVRVPAPNAQAVLDKLQELPERMGQPPAVKCGNGGSGEAANASAYTAEALRSAVADGDLPASVFNHKRSTMYSMERYFETDTGRIVLYNPRLSESDLAVPTLEFPILFCRTCQIAKGPRTHHCKVCDNCVDEMDHHCPWTNCCIGRNNYPYFFGSLFFLHFMVLYAILYNFAQGIRLSYLHPAWDVRRFLRYVYGMPIIVYISFFVLGLFFFPLMLGHLYMTCRGLTTAEMLKQKWKRSEYFGGINPWSQKHWYQNIYARLLQRWPAAQEDPLRWLNSRYYYGVTVAAAVEDQKVDWLLALPPEERKKVEENDAAAREAGAKIREEQEAEIVRAAMEKRGFHVA